MTVVSFCGAIKSGKSTVANMLLKNGTDYKAYAFGDALKEHCATLVPKEEIGWTGKDWSGLKTERGRKILQQEGEGKRKEDSNYWVQTLATQIDKENPKFAIITDARHFNELDWCQKLGKMVYVCNKKAEYDFIKDYQKRGTEALHRSEIEWRLWLLANPYKYLTLENNKSLKDLEERVKSILDAIIKGGEYAVRF